MKSDEIQKKLEETRIRLLVAIEPLPDEALTRPGAAGDWSMKDVLAHFVNWEAELVTGLMRVDQGKKPGRLLDALADRDAYNARRYEENKARDLDRVFDDLQGVRVQLETWIEEFGNRALQDTDRYNWLEGKPLWQLIAETSFAHEAEHIPTLEQFATQWLANPPIAVADVEVKENGNQ